MVDYRPSTERLDISPVQKEQSRVSTQPQHRFKMGMFLNELRLPFDEALAAAKDIGAEYVWFDRLPGETPIAEMSDAEVDRMADRVAGHGLKLFLISAESPFKFLHLTDLALDSIPDHPVFQQDLAKLARSMQIAARLGVGAACSYGFAWPGEYTAGKPTWPMRWATRGGLIADVDMDKLIRAFTLVLEEAERLRVDLVLTMMPWNYTNTTGNFRRLAERLGSPRVKVMWGPADNLNCGEADVATAGFLNVRPYLHCLHLKDIHVVDGSRLSFEYRPLGEGDVDYRTLLGNLRDSRSDAVLSVSTHFRPPSGSADEAMRINYKNLKALIGLVATDEMGKRSATKGGPVGQSVGRGDNRLRRDQ